MFQATWEPAQRVTSDWAESLIGKGHSCMVLVFAIVLSFVPALFYASILYWLDRYEKEPAILLGVVFVWGAVVAATGAFILNTAFSIGVYELTDSLEIAEMTGASISAPLVEESLKGFAVLLVYFVFRREFDTILDGIVYAGITALGFAATENLYYLYVNGYLETLETGGSPEEALGSLLTLFGLRVILGAWNHPFYTAFIGIGLAISRLSRRGFVRLAAPIIGWSVGVFFHFLHNTMAWLLGGMFDVRGLFATLLVDWMGWVIMLGFAIWAIRHEGWLLQTYLREEVKQGIITPQQYYTACSTIRQSSARFRSLFGGRRKTTRRFYQLCGELALKKHHLHTLGDERGNMAIIERLRSELQSIEMQRVET